MPGLYNTLPFASLVSWLVKLLQVLPNRVTLVSGSCGIYHHILLSPHYGRCATTLLVYGQVRYPSTQKKKRIFKKSIFLRLNFISHHKRMHTMKTLDLYCMLLWVRYGWVNSCWTSRPLSFVVLASTGLPYIVFTQTNWCAWIYYHGNMYQQATV
jgi:hypothetical protein